LPEVKKINCPANEYLAASQFYLVATAL
jgi:hypothetical protein